MDRKPRRAPLTKDAIARAAIRLFAERGVEKTTMLTIARSLGVTEPALYRHYATKDDLFAQTFFDAYARIARGVLEAIEGHATLAEAARAAVAMFADLFDRERDLFTFVLIDQHRGLPGAPADPAANPVVAIRDVLARAADAGALPALEVEMAAATAIGVVVQTAIFVHYGRLPGPLSARVETMTRVILAAVGALGRDPTQTP